jgi:hypothetical protein
MAKWHGGGAGAWRMQLSNYAHRENLRSAEQSEKSPGRDSHDALVQIEPTPPVDRGPAPLSALIGPCWRRLVVLGQTQRLGAEVRSIVQLERFEGPGRDPGKAECALSGW